VSENEQEAPQDEPAEAEPAQSEVPEGIDPVTGEVSEPENGDEEPDEDDAEAAAANEREAELAAERQAAEQAQAANEAEIEKQGKALDRASTNYTKKVLEVLGDDLAGWTLCPLCADGYPGLRMPMMPSPENLAAVKVAIGEDPDPPLNDDPFSRKCDTCNGKGVTKTNSDVEGQKKVRCLTCDGRGWLPVGPERDSLAAQPVNGTPAEAAPVPLQADPARTREEEILKAAGAIVVWPPKPPDVSALPGVGGPPI
jgi:hypothetical protein